MYQGTLSSQKMDQDLDSTGIYMKDDQILQYSPIIKINDKLHTQFNENQLAQKGINDLRSGAYFPLNSSNKKQIIEQYGRLFEHKAEQKTSMSKNGLSTDQKNKQFQNNLFNQKPSFLMNSEQISPKGDESHAEKVNQQIIQQYLKEIKQIQDNNSHERKVYQTQIDELQKSNKELVKKLAQANQDFQDIQNSQLNMNNNQLTFRSHSRSPDFFSFANNLNDHSDLTQTQQLNNQDSFKKQLMELQLKNKEYELNIETLNNQLMQNKQYYENLITIKQQKFDKKKEKLFFQCKLILSQMNSIKSELQQLKEQTIMQKENNLEVIQKIDKCAFKIVYDEHQKRQEINMLHLKNILQDSMQQLQEKQLQLEQSKEEYNKEITEKNDKIDQLEIQIQEYEIEKQSQYQINSKKQLNFDIDSIYNQDLQSNISKKYTQEELISEDTSYQQQIESLKVITKSQSRNTLEPSSQYTIKNEKKSERDQPRQRQESRLEEQLKKIQLESMQKYMKMDSKVNKMSVYFSERILQSDKQIQLKDMQIMHKENQIVQKSEQVQEFQKQLQLQEQKQKRNKSQQDYVQKSLQSFVNNQSQEHQEYKRNTSQELRKLQKELHLVNFEKKKQESIILELSQIKENQKEQIQSLKSYVLNQSNNTTQPRHSEQQSNLVLKINEQSRIIKDNFVNEQQNKINMSSRQQGKKEIELKDLMKQLNQVTQKNSVTQQKIGQGQKYVPVAERHSMKNKDYFNDKINQIHSNNHNIQRPTLNKSQQDPQINEFFINKETNLPMKQNIDLKFLF